MGALGAATPFRVVSGGEGGTGQVQLTRQDTLSLLMECQAFCESIIVAAGRIKAAEAERPLPAFRVLADADQLAKIATTYRRGVRTLTGQIDRAPKATA